MGSATELHATGVYHCATRLSGHYSHDNRNEGLRNHLKRRVHHEVGAYIARALEDGREYTVRKWIETAMRDEDEVFIVHASVFLRETNAALVGDAVPLEGLPPAFNHKAVELADGRRFQLERAYFQDMAYWRRVR